MKFKDEIMQAPTRLFVVWWLLVVSARIGLEMTIVAPESYLNYFSFVFQLLWFATTFGLVGVWLHWFMKIPGQIILRFFSLSSVLVLLPVAHAMLFNYQVYFEYFYGTSAEVLQYIVTFGFNYQYISRALSIELVSIFLLLFGFSVVMTKQVFKSLLATVIAYGVIIGVMVSLGNWIGPEFRLAWDLSGYIKNDLSHWIIASQLNANRFIYVLQIVIALFASVVAILLLCPRQALVYFKNMRWERIILFWLLGVLGVAYVQGWLWFDFSMALLIYLLIWNYALALNDVYDLAIDKISNIKRPLVTGRLNDKNMKIVAVISIIAAMLIAVAYGEMMMLLVTASVGLGVAYSWPGLRWRNYLFGIAASTASQASIFIIVFVATSGINEFVPIIIWQKYLLLWLITFLSFQVKDLKDYDGDLATGVKNWLTVFGFERGKRLMAIAMSTAIILLGYLMFDLVPVNREFIYYSVNIITALGLGMYIDTQAQPKEKIIFGLAFLYLGLVIGVIVL